MRKPLIWILSAILLLATRGVLCQESPLLSVAQPSAPATRQQILVLNSYQIGLPIPDSIDKGILSALRENDFSLSDIFIEHLDFPRVPDSEHRANMAALLRHKFFGKPIGIVVLEGAQAINFAANEGMDLFPNVALLTLITPNINTLVKGQRKLIDIPWKVDPAGTLSAAVSLFPGTRRVFVVTGAHDGVLPFLEEAKKAFIPWTDKLDFEYSNTMTYEEMLRRISTLPTNTIIIYSPFFADTSGRSFVPAEVVVKVCKTATVPVFATLEAYLGKGIVGGSLLKTETIGYQAGKISLDYLNGQIKLVKPVTTFEAVPKMMFDWNELIRWKTDINHLPVGCVVINRPFTLWGQYKVVVIISVFVFLALASMVVALLILNRRLIRMKIAANDSEARFRVMVERAPEAIVVYNFDLMRIVDANPKAEKLFGCSLEKLLQGGPERFYHPCQPDGKDISRSMVENSLRALGGEDVVLERVIRSDDGRDLICEVWLVRLPYGEQRLLRASFIDITARKMSDEANAKLQEQLNQIQKMESVGRLAGGVAHDFNNMLGVIIGHTEMALDQIDPTQPIHEDLMEIYKAAERSANLTRQLLAFARKQTVAPRKLDLNETLKGMLMMLNRLIGEDIKLICNFQADLWPINMDPSQIDQILTNLCVNARDAITSVGSITIGTENCAFNEEYCQDHSGFIPGEYVRLSVSDDGRGMDKETLDHIFEPFYTTKGVGEGTGLGLAMVYGAIKQNNGFINTYSEPGMGTTFSIYLCRHKSMDEPIPKESLPDISQCGHETILLVEDEPSILKLTTRILEKLGYTVIAANGPNEAIRMTKEWGREIHLLMTDVIMPEMNGQDLSRNLQVDNPKLKLLFMSGYTANVITHRGVLDEGVFFIQKPFSKQTLAAKIRAVLDKNSN